MDTFLGRYRNLLVLLVVLLAQFIALAVQVRTPAANNDGGKGVRLLRHWVVALIAPPEKAVVHTGSDARGFWGDYIDLRHTREENQSLRNEVDRLRLEQAGLLEDARQGQRLQTLLAFKEHYVSATVPAQVIGTAGSDQSRVLYIDKGARDGLAIDQPVITPDGIVGKIKEVFPHTSQVLEINDQSSGAGVLLEKTRLRGVLRGNAYGQPQVIDILPDERIKPGEPVLTSGGDQIFPRGLPVGTVEKVVADPEREPYVDIVLKPAANLSHLEEVLVVTGTSDALPSKTQRDLARSEAVGGIETEKQRASDILADKLPGLTDPNEPEVDKAAEQKPTGGEEVGRPIQPPQPLRADRFTPNQTPPASSLTPGRPPVVVATANVGAVAVPLKPKHAMPKVDETGGASGTGSAGQNAMVRPSSAIHAADGLTANTGTTPKAATTRPHAANGVALVANGVVHTTVVDGPEAHTAADPKTAVHGTQVAAPGPKKTNQPQVSATPVAKALATPANKALAAKPRTAYVEPKWVGNPPVQESQPQ